MIQVQHHENRHRTFQVGSVTWPVYVTGHYSPEARNVHHEVFGIRLLVGPFRPRSRAFDFSFHRYDREEGESDDQHE